MKWALCSDQSSVRSRGLVQPFKELSSAAVRCARRGCALINQVANMSVSRNKITQSDLEMHSFVSVVLR